jgi:hypothetical protein
MINKKTRLRLRHEFKYHINYLQYKILQKKLSAVLKLDSHAGPDKRYHVRSLYFDDFKNTAFFEKMSGVQHRKKYRIRIYNCSDEYIKLERKTKFDQYVFKENVKLTRKDAERIIASDIGFLSNSKNQLLKTFYLESRHSLLRPVVLVDYHREAYIHPVGNVRITFDIGLHTSMGSVSLFDPCTCAMSVNEEQGVILEVKFNDVLPLFIRGLFPKTIALRTSIGKFTICRVAKNNLLGIKVNDT